ncbi:hypothetical protein BDM02DRAFT_3130628 [Thelephora ganbajun]|uniref:Uncharacterized protein n=1 Tax=Thelephora ganbajun TaxID=370292 RepID=A0ACB6Z8P7_THEGA|nr:hypothetical protein BDM02DRAFT_3130628 [Thelephora ganbajun]
MEPFGRFSSGYLVLGSSGRYLGDFCAIYCQQTGGDRDSRVQLRTIVYPGEPQSILLVLWERATEWMLLITWVRLNTIIILCKMNWKDGRLLFFDGGRALYYAEAAGGQEYTAQRRQRRGWKLEFQHEHERGAGLNSEGYRIMMVDPARKQVVRVVSCLPGGGRAKRLCTSALPPLHLG